MGLAKTLRVIVEDCQCCLPLSSAGHPHKLTELFIESPGQETWIPLDLMFCRWGGKMEQRESWPGLSGAVSQVPCSARFIPSKDAWISFSIANWGVFYKPDVAQGYYPA